MDREKIKVIRKKIFKALKVFAICSAILVVMEIGIGFWLLKTRWHLFISKTQMREFAQELTDSEPLPENFLRIYQVIYPKHVNTSLTEMIFFNYVVRLVSRDHDYDSKPHCFCDLIYDIQEKHNEELDNIEWAGRLVDLEYGYGLEKYTTPDRCFRYFMNEHIRQLVSKIDHSLYPNISRDNIANMTDDEVIEVILLLKSQKRFNRFKNPELFEKYLTEYKLKLALAKANSN